MRQAGDDHPRPARPGADRRSVAWRSTDLRSARAERRRKMIGGQAGLLNRRPSSCWERGPTQWSCFATTIAPSTSGGTPPGAGQKLTRRRARSAPAAPLRRKRKPALCRPMFAGGWFADSRDAPPNVRTGACVQRSF